MQLEPKPLKYKSLPGISERQLSEHHDVLYTGYVNKYNEIVKKLESVDLESANQSYSDLRELNVEKTFTLNGIKLHEYYFDNMTEKPNKCDGKVLELINKKWGSFDKWQAEFGALGMAARGWVVMSYDADLKTLDNYICDAHNQGGIWNGNTILVMDVYEHAYFLDYATARKKYIESFMTTIDWHVINERVQAII